MRVLWLLLLVPLSGCLADGAEDAALARTRVPGVAGADVVVAVVDTGIDPYHEHFAADGLNDAQLDRFVNTVDGEAPRRVALGDGPGEDRALWRGIGARELVHFEGTRVLGISFDDGEGRRVYDEDGHGTAAAGAVLDAHPGAIIVMVEGISTPDAEAWAARQPWIDVVSESYGAPEGPPRRGAAYGLTTSEANLAAWEAGKIVFGAAANTPALAPGDLTSGPPWVIGVAGGHGSDPCRDHVSGTFPDVTADVRQRLPEAGKGTEYRLRSGTSFATPLAAGTVAAVVAEVRATWDDHDGITDGALATGPHAEVRNDDVRDALFLAATYGQGCEVAPWLQAGWGHVDPDAVGPMTDHLLRDERLPEKPEEAVLFQRIVRDYREALWGHERAAMGT